MYNSITPLTGVYGDNLGGLCSFQFVPKEWLADDVVRDLSTGTVTISPALIPGKTWMAAACTDNSMEYNEKDKNDKGGNYIEATLSGAILKDEIAAHIVVDTLRYHELVVIYKDNNSNRRIIGDRKKGMSFAADYTTGKEYKDASVFNISLVHQMVEAAPIYVAP